MRIINICILSLLLGCSFNSDENLNKNNNLTQSKTYNLPEVQQEVQGRKETIKTEDKVQQNKYVRKSLYNKFTILIPRDFNLMDDEMFLYKYANKSKETTKVFTDKDGEVNIALESRKRFNSIEKLEKKYMSNLVKIEGISDLESETKTISNHKFLIITFVSATFDGTVNNMMFFSNISDKSSLVGNVNYPNHLHSKWKEMRKEILNSIKINN